VLAGELPASARPGVARLAAGAAYRYAHIRPKGSALVATLFALRTSGGSALAACLAPAGVDTGACEAIAATLRVTSATVLPLGPSRAYAAALTAALGRLDAARTSHRAGLAHARTRADERRLATALHADYTTASTTVARLAAPPGVPALQASLAAALAQTGTAYVTLAAKIAAGDAAGYDQARRTVVSGERSVARALAALRVAGYAVR
jgi:hypothetical protein